MEAGRTLRALRVRDVWPGGYRLTLPEPVRSWWEAYSTEAAPVRPARTTAVISGPISRTMAMPTMSAT